MVDTNNAGAINRSGTLIAAGSDDNTIHIWRKSDGQLIRVFNASASDINSVDFGPNGNLLASCGDGDSVRIWEVGSCTLKHLFSTDGDAHVVRFNPNDIGGFGIAIPENDAYVVRFNPNGYYLAAGTARGTYIFTTS